MREILFRGKRPDTREWVYGAFIPNVAEMLDGAESEVGFIRRYNSRTRHTETFVVDRKTVGQWTGQRNKNGVRIFEGDIVWFELNDIDGSTHTSPELVAWNATWGGFCVGEPDYEADTLYGIDWVVAGNFYDNPELLEG